MQEEVLEPPLTDSADTAPVQGKPRCITSVFIIHRIYMCCAFTLQEFFLEITCIDTPVLRVLLVLVRVNAMLRSSIA